MTCYNGLVCIGELLIFSKHPYWERISFSKLSARQLTRLVKGYKQTLRELMRVRDSVRDREGVSPKVDHVTHPGPVSTVTPRCASAGERAEGRSERQLQTQIKYKVYADKKRRSRQTAHARTSTRPSASRGTVFARGSFFIGATAPKSACAVEDVSESDRLTPSPATQATCTTRCACRSLRCQDKSLRPSSPSAVSMRVLQSNHKCGLT